MSFFAELKRRNVIRMAGLYLVGAWLIVQVAETVLPTFDAPTWVLRAAMILLAIGFVVGMNASPAKSSRKPARDSEMNAQKASVRAEPVEVRAKVRLRLHTQIQERLDQPFGG
jgi:hypothetical protein